MNKLHALCVYYIRILGSDDVCTSHISYLCVYGMELRVQVDVCEYVLLTEMCTGVVNESKQIREMHQIWGCLEHKEGECLLV